jgi:hypothetical protein
LPSRGTYGPASLLLPPIAIPTELASFVVDYDAPISEPTSLPLAKVYESDICTYQPNDDAWIAEFIQHD